MTRLQDDILHIYNTLTDFSKNTLLAPRPLPIKVEFSESMNSLTFEQQGLKVALPILSYYCLGLKNLTKTYLLPEDYDYLMSSMTRAIESGVLIHDRVCLAPQKYGFQILDTPQNTILMKEGPQLVADIKFISGTSWLFKKLTKLKYERF